VRIFVNCDREALLNIYECELIRICNHITRALPISRVSENLVIVVPNDQIVLVISQVSANITV
jgi:hypothetical protein